MPILVISAVFLVWYLSNIDFYGMILYFYPTPFYSLIPLIPSITWTPERLDLLERLKKEGKSDRECAVLMGVVGEDGKPSPDAVRVARSRASIPAKKSVQLRGTEKGPNTEEDGGPLIGDDLAVRIARLTGQKLKRDIDTPPPTDAILRRYIDDYEAFIKDMCGFELFDNYQPDMLRLIHENPRSCLVMGRQTGKDTITALYSLHYVLTHANSRVIVVSPSQRTSDLWLKTLMDFALSNRDISDSITKASTTHIEVSNNSEIWSLPSGQQGSATIRGFSKVSILIFNEAAWVSNETYAACKPFLAVSDNSKLILISTPFGKQNRLWEYYNNSLFATMNLPSSVSPKITDEFLEGEQDTMDPIEFNSEYLAMFQDLQDSYFPQALITRCTDRLTLADAPLVELIPYFFGIDWGYSQAQTVITVVGRHKNRDDPRGKPRLMVHYIKAFEPGTDIHQQLNHTVFLHNRFRPRRVDVDASGASQIDYLKSKHVAVRPYKFTVDSKVELFGNLKLLMEQGRLAIPDDNRKLLHQLGSFTFTISSSQKLMLHAAKGSMDDYVDSLALAVWGGSRGGGKIPWDRLSWG